MFWRGRQMLMNILVDWFGVTTWGEGAMHVDKCCPHFVTWAMTTNQRCLSMPMWISAMKLHEMCVTPQHSASSVRGRRWMSFTVQVLKDYETECGSTLEFSSRWSQELIQDVCSENGGDFKSLWGGLYLETRFWGFRIASKARIGDKWQNCMVGIANSDNVTPYSGTSASCYWVLRIEMRT